MARRNQRMWLTDGVRWTGTALLMALTVVGCGKPKAEPVLPRPSAKEEPARTSLQERMESPEYLAALKALQAEREAKAVEASEVRVKMEDLAREFQKEDSATASIRQEIDALKLQIAEKEAAIAERVRQLPEWPALEERYRAIEAEINTIRERAQATIQQKMQGQAAAHLAAAAETGSQSQGTPQAPRINKATNLVSFTTIIITNAGVAVKPVEVSTDEEAP